MNSTVSKNQTSSFGLVCTDSNPEYSLQISLIALDFIVFLPIQIWVLWLGISNLRIRGRLAASEIFTMNLSALEFLVIILYSASVVAFAFNYQYAIFLAMFFSGSYLVGRPIMNCLICVERYMAVAHPAMYRNPAFVKHRYFGAGLVWLLNVAYGVLAVSIYPQPILEVYILSLTISILVITACSLGVLKILLRPSPGETQKEGMHHQKKRAFVIITGILVCISVPYGLDISLLIMKKKWTDYTFCLLLGITLWIMRPSSVIQSILYLSKKKKLSFTRKG